MLHASHTRTHSALRGAGGPHTLDTDFQGPRLILPGISIRRADAVVIPEKVTAAWWAHNDTGTPPPPGRAGPPTAGASSSLRPPGVCLDLMEDGQRGAVR